VRLLLDTHVVLWWSTDSPRLSKAARQAIAAADIVWVSAVSGWEIAIKRALGKLRLDGSFAAMVAESDLDELPLTLLHAERLSALARHHGDPFDRMLVAQVQAEGVTFITHDRLFARYDIPIIWA
jgi:PIN domain nuclease of toxin-antitoxin system